MQIFWWVFGVIVVISILRSMWRAYIHPSHVLGRQAANMNWVAIGRIRDDDGYRNIILARDGAKAVISFQNKNVELLEPKRDEPFKDFLELERWLSKKEQESSDSHELKYYEAVNAFINSQGFYQPFLELQGTDKEYCIASMKMHKAGYLAGQSAKVVGALTLDSIKQYEDNRELSILFLQAVEKELLKGNGGESDINDYHPALDKAVSETMAFFESNDIYAPLRENGNSILINSELLVYIASYLAMLRSGKLISDMAWNGFKHSIENRILAKIEHRPSLTDIIDTPEGREIVDYVSEYFTEMSRMEELVLSNRRESGEFDLQPLTNYFFRSLSSSKPEYRSGFQKYLFQLADYACTEIVPKVVKTFEDV